MTVNDFTSYLGKRVNFIYHPFCNGNCFDDLYVLVEGEVTAVCIEKELEKSSFLVGDDFYNFSTVDFISTQFNPVHHS